MERELNVSYKEFHINYLSHLEGTSIWDISLLLGTIIAIGFHTLYARCHLKYDHPIRCFIVDTSFTVPSVLLMTVLNSYIPPVAIISSTSATIIIAYELFLRPNEVPTSKTKVPPVVFAKHRPFITNFKAVISFLTIICILAVDFTIFPLKYAKTEKYGYSLMDTGVGFFIVSNGLTLKVKRVDNLIKKSFIANLPILVLGFIRFATVENMEYQKHTTEYGVHWNFFFTLAVIKFLGALLLAALPKNTMVLGLALLAVHEGMLSTGVGTWVLSDAARNDFISANREGIVSIPGYLSLYLLAVSLGSILVWTDEPFTMKRTVRTGLTCFIVGIGILAGLPFLDGRFPPSRRLANATFIGWMVGLCIFFISLALAMEIVVSMIFRRRNVTSNQDKSAFVLEAISANNLVFFLVCNLLTGAINICVQTLFVPPMYSLMIILTYVFLSCGFICLMYEKKWKLKFW